MFDIAWSELMLIGGVALVVIGPKDLPKAMRTVGQAVGKIRRMASEFQGQFNDAMREAELHDLKKQVEDVGGSVSSAMNSDYGSSDFKPIEMPKDEPPASVGLDDAALKEAEAKLADLPVPDPLPPVEILPADSVAPALAEKPKRRRKAAAVEAEAPEPVAQIVAAPADAAVTTEIEKPKRRRKAAAVEAEAPDPVAEIAAAPADAAETEKPKRRRKAAAAETEAPEPVAEAAAAPPRKRKAKPVKTSLVAEPDEGSAT